MTWTPATALVALLLAFAAPVLAQVPATESGKPALTLAPWLSDHMVVARDKPFPVKGQTQAGAKIVVEFAGQRSEAVADQAGHFLARLPALPASAKGRPLEITVTTESGTHGRSLADVVIGDLWLCSGQSNMRLRVKDSADAKACLAAADLPTLRLLDFAGGVHPGGRAFTADELTELAQGHPLRTNGWQRSSAATAAEFSAVAHAFGRKLTAELDVPIGLIHNSIGGSPMESWLPRSVLKNLPAELRDSLTEWLGHPKYAPWCQERARLNLSGLGTNLAAASAHPAAAAHPYAPHALYEAAIAPLSGIPVHGVIWYQGESNAAASASGPPCDPFRNRALLRSVIASFRTAFANPDLPFLMTQLPGMRRDWRGFRESQKAVADSDPYAFLAITLDLGHPTDVHPRRKTPVGERLALLALNHCHERRIDWSGPRALAVDFDGDTAVVKFAHADGLRTTDGHAARCFEIAGSDGIYHPAESLIVENVVRAKSPAVRGPESVRYAFSADPNVNLINGAGLPAEPFRTDRTPLRPDPTLTDPSESRRRTPTHVESFESIPPGPVRRSQTAIGHIEAAASHAEITARFAHTGSQCLRLLGGDGRSVVVTELPARAERLSFRAERWTRRSPFEFRIDARLGNDWQEIYVGDSELRVGARFLSDVAIELPDGVRALRLRSTSPKDTGVLIDDLQIGPREPMHLTRIAAGEWTAPALIGKTDNPIARLDLTTSGSASPLSLRRITVDWHSGSAPIEIETAALFASRDSRFERPERLTEPLRPSSSSSTFELDRPLQPGANYIWLVVALSAQAERVTSIQSSFSAVSIAGATGPDDYELDRNRTMQRVGVALRTAGQDGCHTSRIPGLATTNDGTLIAVYDLRYQGSGDLPGNIDVGMSRSTDGGFSWEPTRVIMDMGEDPDWRFDGIGDPAVLVDRRTNRIWVAATWSHGNRSWNGSGPGMTPEETGQLMLTHSDDNGSSWSEPRNITAQIKDPAWRFVLQGPGKGITMADGTLVFPAQFRSSDASEFGGKPFSTLIYSKDRGETWTIGTGIKVDTTEAQLVELEDGQLMINCRDNRGGSRSVYVTTDLGATWTEHSSSRSALPEPVCMASLIRVPGPVRGDLLAFSNPATTKGRRDMTVKLSEDFGTTWPRRWHTLYDKRAGYGYSCLTVIDDQHIGVLYEGAREIYFLRLPIRDLVQR